MHDVVYALVHVVGCVGVLRGQYSHTPIDTYP